MATVNLARGSFVKEHSQKTAAANGADTFVLDPYSVGISVKTEFQNAAATGPSCVVRALWTMLDGTTQVAQSATATNLDLQGGTIETSARHGEEVTFSAPAGARKVRVDLMTPPAAGYVSVWAAAR